MKIINFDLQLFADGGDGGAASVGGAPVAGTSDDASVEATQTPTANDLGIPDSVMKKVYKGKAPTPVTKAEAKAESPAESAPVKEDVKAEAEEPTYEELIKSDKYKNAHEKYIKKTLDDRMKKVNADRDSSHELLSMVALKYGLDPDADNFKADLKAAMDRDDSYVSNYADKHDMTNEEARRVLEMENKMKRLEREKQEAEKAAATRQLMDSLRRNAEATKARFPEFDLDVMMQNEDFARMIGLTRGNTTAAYMAVNYDAVLKSTAQDAEAKAKSAVANSVKSNSQRPVENGISQSATAIVKTDVKNMSLKDIKAVAEHYRKTGERIKF